MLIWEFLLLRISKVITFLLKIIQIFSFFLLQFYLTNTVEHLNPDFYKLLGHIILHIF